MNLAPPLLAVAHGSRDPRHAAAMAALAARVRALRPGLRVEIGYLDHCGPRVPERLAELAEAGADTAVAVPLLFTPAFHAKQDVPNVLRRRGLTVHQTATLAPSPLLLDALNLRMHEAGVRPGDARYGVVLATAGSTDPEANAVTTIVAREWRRTGWCAVVPAFASVHRGSTVAAAVEGLRALGAERIAVASCMLAPGILPDRIVEQALAAGAESVTEPVADTAEIARLVLDRYDAALPARSGLSA
ncbi:cobalamin biosynthesis protein CbiX [Embleya scabrispora]|uniref:Cobalamin biosynthesis protein CbiX n=1 Tax=Embleya scabrispora TaxID=159449 RepID=A0A1T3NUP7_9ACTN|nr:sirohydrochlorin chelatase [Embleya scabrispora]OPC80603.1 cobalamin biosynthesis protein CbiX [Embleya scabrispora]